MIDNRGSLRKRITLLVLLGISIILLSLGIASHYIIQKSVDDSLNKKLALARLIRNNIDNIIQDNINRLYDISLSGRVDLRDRDLGPEKDAVKTAYRYSIFTDGIFLVDNGGNIVFNYPERIRETALNVLSIEPVSRMIAEGKPVVSNIYTIEPIKKKVLYVLVPLKDKNGDPAGAAGGQIDPTNPLLIQKLGLIDIGQNEFIDIVDSNGMVIGSSNPAHTLAECNRGQFFTTLISAREERVATCHHCHVSGNRNVREQTIVAFTPLETAPWGISVQELKKDVFAPIDKLKRTFLALGVVFIGTAFILTIGMNRSIVNPLKELIRGAERIAKGELSKPILPQGSDEIGVLSRSFETMRMRLVESMESIKRHALDLESRVRERTKQIKESQKRAEYLLKKVITSQEDERKRIGRHLHDDTLQDLSAALMQIDMCKLHPEEVTPHKINKMREIVLKTWEGVIAIIQNLRPTLLDDLGLTAAIKSLLDKHLGEKGINYFMNTEGMKDERFGPEMEITLFRIVQEAIMNIARHARAENVFVLFKIEDNTVHVDIEDDGEGFELNALTHQPAHDMKDRRGLGIMGMKERALQLGGKMEICSQPGIGTKIQLKIPLMPAEVVNVEEKGSYRG
jgi:signal transduction histidine kinase